MSACRDLPGHFRVRTKVARRNGAVTFLVEAMQSVDTRSLRAQPCRAGLAATLRKAFVRLALTVARLALAVFFIVTGVRKLAGLKRFRDVVAGYHLLPRRLEPAVAVGVPVTEAWRP